MASITLLEGRAEQAQQLVEVARDEGLFSSIGTAICHSVQGKIDPSGLPSANGDNVNLRQDVTTELLAAAAAKAAGQPATLRRHVESAMRLAVREALVSVFLEHREVVIKVSAELATGAFARGHLQLARMAKHIHKLVRSSYVMPQGFLKLGMTNQQLRVLTALENGSSNKQIARNLGISEATVKFHVHNLFQKLGVRKRGELIESAAICRKNRENSTF